MSLIREQAPNQSIHHIDNPQRTAEVPIKQIKMNKKSFRSAFALQMIPQPKEQATKQPFRRLI